MLKVLGRYRVVRPLGQGGMGEGDRFETRAAQEMSWRVRDELR